MRTYGNEKSRDLAVSSTAQKKRPSQRLQVTHRCYGDHFNFYSRWSAVTRAPPTAINYLIRTLGSYHWYCQFQTLKRFILVVRRYSATDAFHPGAAAWVNSSSGGRRSVALGFSIFSSASGFCHRIFHAEMRFCRKQKSIPKQNDGRAAQNSSHARRQEGWV